MENVRWVDPVLTFSVERHGPAVNGSTRAEVQCWEVNLNTRVAEIVGTRRRQLRPMQGRWDPTPVAAEVARAILDRRTGDPRVRWLKSGKAMLELCAIPELSVGFKRTLAARRKDSGLPYKPH